MSKKSVPIAPMAPVTTIVHRPDGRPNGLRNLTDDTTRIAVAAFPLVETSQVIGTGGFATAGAYVLAGEDHVYIGETGNVARRLIEHVADPHRRFARDAYVIRASDGVLDKAAVSYFQHRLTEAAEVAGLMRVVKGVSANSFDLPAWRAASLDRMLAAAMMLMFDGGCRAFHASPARMPVGCPTPQGNAAQDNDPPGAREVADTETDGDATGLMPNRRGAQGASLAEPRKVFQLAYGGQRAIAVGGRRGAVIKAGSEVRRTPLGWYRRSMQTLREEYLRTGNLIEVPNRDDVWQLATDTYFQTLLHAGRFLTYSHRGLEVWRETDSAA